MTLLNIRPAKEGDSEGLAPLRLAYFESQLALGLLDELIDLVDYVRSGTPRLLASQRSCVLVAESDEQIFGYAIASFRIVPGARAPSICSIEEVFVLPESRGAGLASRLVSVLLDEAARRKVDRTQIRVLSGNPKARVLWEQLGFVENVAILEFVGQASKRVDKRPGRVGDGG